MSTPSVAQLVERLTVVVDAVLGILRNQLVTSSILVVRTSLLLLASGFSLFIFRFTELLYCYVVLVSHIVMMTSSFYAISPI